MRKHVSSLPKTKSGAPAFDKSSQVTWPYFTKLLFMKDEFVGRRMKSSYPEDSERFENYDCSHSPHVIEIMDEDILEEAHEASGIRETERSCPSRQSESSADNIVSIGNSASARKKPKKMYGDNIEEKKLSLLKESIAISKKKMEETKDPLDVFAMDMANDLKLIKNRKILIETKMELQRIIGNALLKDTDSTCVTELGHAQEPYQTGTNYVQGPSNIQPAYETHAEHSPTNLSRYTSTYGSGTWQ